MQYSSETVEGGIIAGELAGELSGAPKGSSAVNAPNGGPHSPLSDDNVPPQSYPMNNSPSDDCPINSRQVKTPVKKANDPPSAQRQTGQTGYKLCPL